MSLCDEFLAKLLLEVFGAAGAVWGSSEVLAIRTPENSATVFRPLAASIGILFFVRWCMQLYMACQQWQCRMNNKLHSVRKNDGGTFTNILPKDLESLVLLESQDPSFAVMPRSLSMAPTVSMDEEAAATVATTPIPSTEHKVKTAEIDLKPV
jgi:hypothetical protein